MNTANRNMKIFITSLWLALGVVLTLLADVALKRSDLFALKWLLVGVVLYGLVAIPVAILFRMVEFGNLFIIWEAAYLILGIVVATLFYREPLTSYRITALILSIIAMVLAYK